MFLLQWFDLVQWLAVLRQIPVGLQFFPVDHPPFLHMGAPGNSPLMMPLSISTTISCSQERLARGASGGLSRSWIRSETVALTDSHISVVVPNPAQVARSQ
jgi:hypothetical protein